MFQFYSELFIIIGVCFATRQAFNFDRNPTVSLFYYIKYLCLILWIPFQQDLDQMPPPQQLINQREQYYNPSMPSTQPGQPMGYFVGEKLSTDSPTLFEMRETGNQPLLGQIKDPIDLPSPREYNQPLNTTFTHQTQQPNWLVSASTPLIGKGIPPEGRIYNMNNNFAKQYPHGMFHGSSSQRYTSTQQLYN